MSASPIPMMTAAPASASGVGSTDVAPGAGDAFGAMVASAEAAANDQGSPAETRTSGTKTEAAPAEALETPDKDLTSEETTVAPNLLTGAALYLIQPQPAPTGETDIAAEASAGSAPSLPADADIPLPVSPPAAGLDTAPAPEASGAQSSAGQTANVNTPALPAASLTGEKPAPAPIATPEVATSKPAPETPQTTEAEPAAPPVPSKTPEPAAAEPAITTAAPAITKPVDSEVVNEEASAAAARTAAATATASLPSPTVTPAAAQQVQPAARASGRPVVETGVAAPATGPAPEPVASTTGDTPVVDVDDAPVVQAALPPIPLKAPAPTQPMGTPVPTPPVAEPAAPLRASNAAASDKTLSAVVRADTRSGAAASPTASAAPGATPAVAPTPPTVATGAIAASADALLAPLPDVVAASSSPDTPSSAASAPITTSADTVAAVVTQSLSSLSRATIETTAQIAAQITRRLEGRSTRFEMKLAPEGLGNVDVSLDIGADGQLAARLAFDNPLAATELRGRADELRRQLEDAGFTIARDALDFAERDPSSAGGGDGFDRRQNSRAFANASRLAAEADAAIPPPAAWVSLSLTPRGVDMKV